MQDSPSPNETLLHFHLLRPYYDSPSHPLTMAPLRFRAAERITESNHGRWKGGRYVSGGYVHVRVKSHPKQDKRGYVMEHILVAEETLGRNLNDGETVHHKDGNRQNNRPWNLEVMYSHKEHMEEHPRKRNPNAQFVAADPIFEEIKFRLHDIDAGVTKVYSLSKLINTTFRRGKFQFRGRSTGLKDKNGREIFEGDIIKTHYGEITSVIWGAQSCDCCDGAYGFGTDDGKVLLQGASDHDFGAEVIGNIYEHPDLLPS